MKILYHAHMHYKINIYGCIYQVWIYDDTACVYVYECTLCHINYAKKSRRYS